MGLTVATAALAVSLSAPLQEELDDFAAHADATQYRQVADAITGSPALTAELNALAEAGTLKGFEIDATGKPNPFAAMARDGKIIFMPVFLVNVAQAQPFDARQTDSIPPNTMTFVLGHLAAHIRTPSPMPNGPTANDLKTFIQMKMVDEATADIAGWNDMVDAAQVANGGKPLTVQQGAYLLTSLRYRAVFFNALRETDDKLSIANAGYIEPTPENIAALGNALKKTNLFDFD
ncbi:MAG: hypothetical protein PW843_12975 [Azospirillaceae bacterium]|nr:hypothetical protein [Azospirillaceae bacterium]